MLACVTPNCFTGLLGKLARGSQKAEGSNLPWCRSWSSISICENWPTKFAFHMNYCITIRDSWKLFLSHESENIVIKLWQEGVGEISGFGLNTELRLLQIALWASAPLHLLPDWTNCNLTINNTTLAKEFHTNCFRLFAGQLINTNVYMAQKWKFPILEY